MKNKYEYRKNASIKLFINNISDFFLNNISKKDTQIYIEIISGINKKEIINKFNINIGKIRQITASVKRKLKTKNSLKYSLENVEKNIFNCFYFNQRYTYVGPELFLYYNNFKNTRLLLIKDIAIDSYWLQYLTKKLTMNPIIGMYDMFKKIGIKNIKNIFGNKAIFHNKILFLDKHQFLEWIILRDGMIKVDKNNEEIIIAFGKSSNRAITSNLERYKYLWKADKTTFIAHDPKKMLFYNELIPFVYEAINQKIYKFKDIMVYLSKVNKNIKNIFPIDSLYYLIKRYNEKDFNFDKGNRKIIYPLNKNIVELREYLKDKFPTGISEINYEELIKEGFSESIAINTDLLINKTLYISEIKLEEIKTELRNIFSQKNVIFYMDDMIDIASEDLKLMLIKGRAKIKISNWFTNIIFVNKSFIKINEEYSIKEINDISRLLGDYIFDRFSIEDFELIFKGTNSNISKFIIKNNKVFRGILEYIYQNRQIVSSRKTMIKDIMEKQFKI